MKPLNFVIVGVGGQGILLASDVLCQVGVACRLRREEDGRARHGPARRQRRQPRAAWRSRCTRRWSPPGAADYLLAFEKLEACRWVDFLRCDGVAVVNDESIPTLALVGSPASYPDDETIGHVLATHAADVGLVPAAAVAARPGQPASRQRRPAGQPLALPGATRQALAPGAPGARARPLPRPEPARLRRLADRRADRAPEIPAHSQEATHGRRELSRLSSTRPQEVVDAIGDGLGAYNDSFTGEREWERIAIAVKDDAGNVIGGLTGAFGWDWLHVTMLWLDQSVRGQDVGTRADRHGRAGGAGSRHHQHAPGDDELPGAAASTSRTASRSSAG